MTASKPKPIPAELWERAAYLRAAADAAYATAEAAATANAARRVTAADSAACARIRARWAREHPTGGEKE